VVRPRALRALQHLPPPLVLMLLPPLHLLLQAAQHSPSEVELLP